MNIANPQQIKHQNNHHIKNKIFHIISFTRINLKQLQEEGFINFISQIITSNKINLKKSQYLNRPIPKTKTKYI